MAENVLSWETVSGHITQRDLNRYYLLDVYLQAHFSDYVLLPGWFSEHSHLARPEKRDFIASLKRFLLSYRPAGRLTIFRYLNMFFIWQSVNQYDYGTAEGVEMYIKHLMNDIRRRKISVRMARHYLSVVNRFLLTGGQIQRRYEYEFLPKGTYQQQGRDSYTRNELSETNAKLAALSAGSEGLADRVKQAEIRAPMNGTVKQLFANTVGGVVQPGKEIIEIVPGDDALLLEARVQPKDIAFLRPGQPARVKFTAYDFSIYGGLDAKVENISPDTQVDEKGNAFYVVRVRTGQPSFGDDKPIIPGMTAEVDILTGKKTVLSYLLKPVLKAKAYALRER